ncbi:Like-Sm ribonucleoprotein core [Halorubrum aidingense JCM 13560]|uniref:Like-Sm ribonucleoprotein core n=1 Tax=Halorubrum aidingense JCM 13560 TaxID=1230454 RepID=M0PG09_9EURY|nr:LSM domain-containing protein [Halorubrum aidingense]EMA67725.1 Like-Sm ribonucleoprotein core [Halorubrum aidingense JCM 13560]
MSGRPLDVLEASLEEPVTVHLKDGTTYYGILAGYDQHMNVVIEPESGVDDRVDDELDGEFAVAIEDTTIIRGDNVVTIKA